MYSFFVNGCQVSTSQSSFALPARMKCTSTSVKDWIAVGGLQRACTVLIDGDL